ncbi:MAG: hypothetical protein V5A55_08420 [Halovenus sp.]
MREKRPANPSPGLGDDVEQQEGERDDAGQCREHADGDERAAIQPLALQVLVGPKGPEPVVGRHQSYTSR